MSDVFKNVVTLDFETYYDKKFSLSKITMEEYVRSPEFEIIGVGIKTPDDDKPSWCSGDKQQIKRWLGQFDLEECTVLAHNTMFDGAILSWVLDIHPKYYCDTLLMSRAIFGLHEKHNLKFLAERMGVGEKGDEVHNAIGKHRGDFTDEEMQRYADYCKQDVALTDSIYHLLEKRYQFPLLERCLIDLTIKMYVEPTLRLDKKLLYANLDKVVQAKQNLLDKAGVEKEVLLSNPKFAELLEQHGVAPPTKVSLRTGKETFAFAKSDKGFNDLLEHTDPKIKMFAEARLGIKSTLEETRTQRLIDISERGSLPAPLIYYGAHTGRWGGGGKINLQNLPSRNKQANIIKKAIIAPDGYVIVEADSSQIEARMVAWYSGQDDLVEQFKDVNKDPYKIMAGKIYKVDPELITSEQRFLGKQLILACQYGMGHKKFRAQIANEGRDISEEDAKKAIQVYRTANSHITNLWYNTHENLKAMLQKRKSGNVPVMGNELVTVEGTSFVLPNGLKIHYHDLRLEEETDEENKVINSEMFYTSKNGKTKIYGAKSVENITQALARIVIGQQMLKISEKYRVAMTVHDSIVCVVPEAEASVAQEYIERCMRETPVWAEGLPLDCESGVAKSYGDC